MSDLTKGLLTVLVAAVLASTAVALVNFLLGKFISACAECPVPNASSQQANSCGLAGAVLMST